MIKFEEGKVPGYTLAKSNNLPHKDSNRLEVTLVFADGMTYWTGKTLEELNISCDPEPVKEISKEPDKVSMTEDTFLKQLAILTGVEKLPK